MLLCAWGANPRPPPPLEPASLLPQHSQLFNMNTCPDSGKEKSTRPCEGSEQERFWEDLTFFCSICILTVAHLQDASKSVASLLS